jgi:hypothetical protein
MRHKALIASTILFSSTFILVTESSSAAQSTESEPESTEVYIPINLEDCFAQLNKLLKPEDIEMIKASSEEDMVRYHFGMGMWLRNNWGLWGNSRLATWFNERGIHHPDDMSAIILDSYWRHLNQRQINLEEQIKYYQEYWRRIKELQNDA